MQGVGRVGAVAFGSMSLLTAGIVKAGAGMEQTQIAFETMLGSAERADKLLREISGTASTTPFELAQLEEAAKRLLAYGTAADDVVPQLRMLGDIAAGVGMDKMPQLILAFGQVQAATRLTGMELRQFTEAGVPLLEELAKHFERPVSEIQEMVTAGKVGFADVQAALANLTGEGGRFFNLMERQSGSLAGQWSNFKDQIALTARAIGEQLLPYLKPVMEYMIGLAHAVRDFVAEHPRLSASILVLILGLTGLMALLLPLAMALPGLIIMWGGLGTAIGAVAAVIGVTTAPMLAMILFLGMIGYTAYRIATQWQDAWDLIRIVVGETANAVQAIVETMINFIITGINSMITKINGLISRLAGLPFVGGQFKKLTIPELERIAFDRIDTGSMYNEMMARPRSATLGETIINVTGNTFLDEDSAEKMGDLLIGKLKMSNAL